MLEFETTENKMYGHGRIKTNKSCSGQTRTIAFVCAIRAVCVWLCQDSTVLYVKFQSFYKVKYGAKLIIFVKNRQTYVLLTAQDLGSVFRMRTFCSNCAVCVVCGWKILIRQKCCPWRLSEVQGDIFAPIVEPRTFCKNVLWEQVKQMKSLAELWVFWLRCGSIS